MTDSSGASVTFPAGAVTDDTTFRIAMDSTGAPPVPAGMTTAGSTYVITPHGGHFAEPVEVAIPVPAVTLRPDQQLLLAKAEPNGQWEILGNSTVADGKLKATVRDFSFVTSVVITYPLPILQRERFMWGLTLDCGEQDCKALVGPTTLTYTATGNGGQLPQPCVDGRLATYERGDQSTPSNRHEHPLSGGTVTTTVAPPNTNYYDLFVVLECWSADHAYNFSGYIEYVIFWAGISQYPSLSIARMPSQVDVVEGLPAGVEAYLFGGARKGVLNVPPPTTTDHAIVDWLRSDNGGASWQTIGRSFQHEANPQPFGTGAMWAPWSVKHVFTATAADQGALIRVNACYTPPAPTEAPPCVTSAPTRINVVQHSAFPVIVDQPRSVLVHTVETANFSVSASGIPAPALQWQTRPANSTGEWSNVSLGSGATTANYTTPPRVPSDNGEQYRVVATNALGSVASSPVTLSVSDLVVAPSITTQPASLGMTSGGDAVFAVVAYGTEALSYQWRFNGTNIDGANSPVLRLNGVTAANGGSYSVAVSNSAGNVISNAAVLTVTAGAPAAVTPSIVTQPSPATVGVGNTATLAVGVAGTGPFSFQWLRDGVVVNGATSAVLTFNSVALPNAGNYSVRVTNSAGQVVSDNVALNIVATSASDAPVITSEPATLIVPLNGSGTIAVGASGSGPLSYQWYLNGNPLPGATLPVLNFSHLGSVDFGTYTVTVTNSMGSATSEPADLILLGAPAITQQPADATVPEGGQATFFVQADGSGLRYQWSVNGTPVPGAISATFNTPSLVAANTGAVYSVMVYNGAGLVTSQGAVLTVQAVVAPSVTQQPVNATIQPGQTAQICASFGGSVPMFIEFQRWNGSSWAPYIDFSANNNGAQCFPTPALALSDSGAQFRVIAENSAGETASDAMTVAVAAPQISATTLVSVALNGGEPDYFSGTPSLSADGRFVTFTSEGTNLIAGGTNARNHAYLRDLATGTTSLINRTTSGGESAYGVQNLVLSANGRYAVFTSFATDLVSDDTNNSLDVFRRDLLTGTTVRVSVLPDGSQIEGMGNGNYDARLAISGDGRFVAFISTNDLDVGGTGASNDDYFLYVRDMQTGITRYVDGTHALSPVGYVAMSENGRYLAYTLNVVSPNDQTIWLYDTETLSKRAGYTYQQPPYPAGQRQGLSISATGRFLAFAVNSVPLTGSASDQIMVVDLDDPGTPILASTGPNGAGDANSLYPKLSGDGRYVLFETYAPNLTSGLGNSSRRYSVVRDLVAGTTKIASIGMNGAPVSVGFTNYGSHVISSDGRVVAFETGQVYATPRP